MQFSERPGAGLGYAPAGRFEYVGLGETAIDTITYTAEDRHGARATGTVAVTVIGANDAPTATNDQASTDEDFDPGASSARQRYRPGSDRPVAGERASTASRLSLADASRLLRVRA